MLCQNGKLPEPEDSCINDRKWLVTIDDKHFEDYHGFNSVEVCDNHLLDACLAFMSVTEPHPIMVINL